MKILLRKYCLYSVGWAALLLVACPFETSEPEKAPTPGEVAFEQLRFNAERSTCAAQKTELLDARKGELVGAIDQLATASAELAPIADPNELVHLGKTILPLIDSGQIERNLVQTAEILHDVNVPSVRAKLLAFGKHLGREREAIDTLIALAANDPLDADFLYHLIPVLLTPWQMTGFKFALNHFPGVCTSLGTTRAVRIFSSNHPGLSQEKSETLIDISSRLFAQQNLDSELHALTDELLARMPASMIPNGSVQDFLTVEQFRSHSIVLHTLMRKPEEGASAMQVLGDTFFRIASITESASGACGEARSFSDWQDEDMDVAIERLIAYVSDTNAGPIALFKLLREIRAAR